MREGSKCIPESAEKTVRGIRRGTRRHHSAEEKIRIVLEGLRGEDSIAELCRKEGINQDLYYRWSKEFLEAHRTGGTVVALNPPDTGSNREDRRSTTGTADTKRAGSKL
jgi:transposase-like protein